MAKSDKGPRQPPPSKVLAKRPMKKGRKGVLKSKRKERRMSSGPHMPNSMKKELGLINRKDSGPDAEESDEDVIDDIYEYEERIAEEESTKNRRYDAVENYEFELPFDFKDEEVPSDDDEGGDDENDDEGSGSDDLGYGKDDKHLRMLEGITGMPKRAFEGSVRKGFEYTDIQGDLGGGEINIQDLLDPLYGTPGYSRFRKQLHKLESKPMTVHAPLRKAEREKLERKVAYEHSKKDITMWEPLVKKNREAPTLFFDNDLDLGHSTMGSIASEFQPRTEFEKKMTSIMHDSVVANAHMNDGAKLLELNKVSVEDVRDRQNRLAKMRSLLFHHEMKAKHIKKIKSKTYHRLSTKKRLKEESKAIEMDPEAAKAYFTKMEFKRAQERMTLKHKNSSKWAKRILKRGLNVQDEGTRVAIAEQLNQHALLTRKMKSMKESSSSDESSDEDEDEVSPPASSGRVSTILNNAKDKTTKIIEEGDDILKSGVFALPFMQRSLKKRQEAADEEAHLAIEEYDSALRQLECGNGVKVMKAQKTTGRKIFLAADTRPQKSSKKESEHIRNNSDDRNDSDASEPEDVGHEDKPVLDGVLVASVGVSDEMESHQRTMFKSFEHIVKDPGPKFSYDASNFASASSRKKAESKGRKEKLSPVLKEQDEDNQFNEEDQNNTSDSDVEVIEGMTSSGLQPEYELPSQADLIHRAFAGDDVEAEFEKDKLVAIDDENPEPEKPVLVPGWGQWTSDQKKRGIPSWQREEYDIKKRKWEKTIKERKDGQLKHAIISEAIDKKAEKLLTKTVPYPYTSKEVFESSIRMPIGPEYNTIMSTRALIRPSVVKKSGVIIKPIEFEEVDPRANADKPTRVLQRNVVKSSKKKAKKSNEAKKAQRKMGHKPE